MGFGGTKGRWGGSGSPCGVFWGSSWGSFASHWSSLGSLLGALFRAVLGSFWGSFRGFLGSPLGAHSLLLALCWDLGAPFGAAFGALWLSFWRWFGGSFGSPLQLCRASFGGSSWSFAGIRGLFWGSFGALCSLLLGLFRAPFRAPLGALLGALLFSELFLGLFWGSSRSPLGLFWGSLEISVWGSSWRFVGVFLELLFGGFVWGCFEAIETLCRKECRILISFSNSLPAKC